MSGPPSIRTKTISNSIWNFTGYGIALVLTILITPIVISKLGLEYIGIYGLITAVLAPLDLASLGFGEATIKYVAKYHQLKDFVKVQEYISTTYFMNIAVGIFSFLVIAAAGTPLLFHLFSIDTKFYEEVKVSIYIVAAGWLIRQLTGVFISVPTALQNFRIISIGNLITSVSGTLITLGFIWYSGTLISYTLATVVGSLLTLVFWYVASRKLLVGISFVPKIFKEVWKSSFTYGGWQTLANIGSIVTTQADKYILGIYLNPYSVGIYSVVLQVEQRILVGILKFVEVLFPMFSAISDEENTRKFSIIVRTNVVVSFGACLFYIPLVVLAKPILALWLGEAFASQGYVVLQCLILVALFATLTASQNYFFMGNGNIKLVTFLYYFTGLVTVVASFILIPRFGLTAAGWGILIAAVLRLVPFHYFMKRTLGNSFSHYTYSVSLYLPTGISIFTMIVAIKSGYFLPETLPGLLLGLIVCGTLLFILMLAGLLFVPGGSSFVMEGRDLLSTYLSFKPRK